MSARSRSEPWWGPRNAHLLHEPYPPGTYVTPSGTMTIGEIEYVGKIPVRTDLTVLPADDAKKAPMGFMCQCFNGGEVYKPGALDTPLTRREDIQPGDKLIVTTLFAVLEMTATLDDEGELQAETEHTLANLEFGEDDRECWVSSFAINKRAFKTATG